MEGHRVSWNLKGWQRCEWEVKGRELDYAGGMVQRQVQRQT